jgi:hypothetical protein
MVLRIIPFQISVLLAFVLEDACLGFTTSAAAEGSMELQVGQIQLHFKDFPIHHPSFILQ